MPEATADPSLVLAGEFEPATREQWRSAVDKALRGGDFERLLVSRTLDDVRIEPLYTAADVATEHDEAGFPAFAPMLRGQSGPPRPDGAWDIRARVTHPDPTRANAQALADLRGGATSIDVVVDAAGSGHGVSCRNADDLERVLSAVLLDVAAVSLRAGAHGSVAADWLLEVWRRRGVVGTQTSGCLGLDPLGALAADGTLPQGLDTAMADAVSQAQELSEAAPRVRAFRASGLVAADAGASEGEEIAFVLAAATAYLRAMVDNGMSIKSAARQIDLELFADVDLFATVAKVRALRHCWATVLAECGLDVDDATPGLTAVDLVAGGRWLTVADPWVNLLRATTATTAAVLGGADAVIVDPFDSAEGVGSDQGHRLARNTQLLLQDESGVGRVIDPAGGSYYVEALTDALAEVGWADFQRHERAGGLAEALRSGAVADTIDRIAAARGRRVATRAYPITGVSEYPLLDERRPESESLSAFDPRPPVELDGTPTLAPALVSRRLSQPFEELRAAAEGPAPTVFLANISAGPSYVPRATFASNLFGAGGVRAVGEGGYETAAEMATAFLASRASVAVICGTDAAYADRAAAFAEALKAAGARYVYLAGRPGDDEQGYRDSGIDEFVASGTDVLSVLGRLHGLLRVES